MNIVVLIHHVRSVSLLKNNEEAYQDSRISDINIKEIRLHTNSWYTDKDGYVHTGGCGQV